MAAAFATSVVVFRKRAGGGDAAHSPLALARLFSVSQRAEESRRRGRKSKVRRRASCAPTDTWTRRAFVVVNVVARDGGGNRDEARARASDGDHLPFATSSRLPTSRRFYALAVFVVVHRLWRRQLELDYKKSAPDRSARKGARRRRQQRATAIANATLRLRSSCRLSIARRSVGSFAALIVRMRKAAHMRPPNATTTASASKHAAFASLRLRPGSRLCKHKPALWSAASRIVINWASPRCHASLVEFASAGKIVGNRKLADLHNKRSLHSGDGRERLESASARLQSSNSRSSERPMTIVVSGDGGSGGATAAATATATAAATATTTAAAKRAHVANGHCEQTPDNIQVPTTRARAVSVHDE